MNTLLDLPDLPVWIKVQTHQLAAVNYRNEEPIFDPHKCEGLRRCAWEIGEKRAADHFALAANHVGLAQVTPSQGFAYWRIRQEWIDETACNRGQSWHNCRLVLRLYDVSNIVFNGFNAHGIQDHDLPAISGQRFFKLARPGTWQLGEVGFLLRSGEFLPAARSRGTAFAPDTATGPSSTAALLVNGRGRPEEIANLWDQDKILRERRQPRLRSSLRLAAFAFEALHTGSATALGRFVSELAAGQCRQGHEVHVFVPASEQFGCDRQVDGVHYHPLPMNGGGTPLELARRFGRAADEALGRDAPFDSIHLHEWMTGLVYGQNQEPRILSLSSIEASRRQDAPVTEMSRAIADLEQEIAKEASLVLVPDWLKDRAIHGIGLDARTVRDFPMEGRMPNQWEEPIDPGQIKMSIGFGPLDRMVVFIGPMEHAAGVDVLLDAMPTVMNRMGNVRVAFIGEGHMRGHLQDRAHQLGCGHAMRLLGHVEGPMLSKLLRASEALVLPSRYRVPFDDAVVDLARRAGRPVVTTHGGPAHLIRHEENGLVTYDNPGSMVWALDRILGDPAHAERMGQHSRRSEDRGVVWADVAKFYFELCALYFPTLRQAH